MQKAAQKTPEGPVRSAGPKSEGQAHEAPLDPWLRLQRAIGNQAVGRLLRAGGIQTKLRVSQPGDLYEQEADRIADQVMRSPAPHTLASSSGPPSLQRKCTACAEGRTVCPKCEEEQKVRIQRKPQPASGAVAGGESVPDRFLSHRGSGRAMDPALREFMELRFGHDFSGVRIHTDTRASESARAVNALAFTLGRDIVFAPGQFAPDSPAGLRLLSHELAHTLQQGRTSGGPGTTTLQRLIEPEDVSSEMVGQFFQVAGAFTSGPIQLGGGEHVEVVAWSNTSSVASVQLPSPHLHAHTAFDIPKRLLRPIPPRSGLVPYSAEVTQQARTVERGAQAIAAERARRGGPRPGEIPRLEGLQRTRQSLLNRRLIQETMLNRFDPVIETSVSHYNREFGFVGARAGEALDPNLVKSMFFQESQMGTAGQHLEEPPTHPVKTRFNIGQMIDSSAAGLLIMMKEMEPALLTTYHLQDLRRDLSAAQTELARLKGLRRRTPAQRTRMEDLERLSAQSWETFHWQYRAAGQTTGFQEAVNDFFALGAGVPSRNVDYEFWIRTAVRWLFEKRQGVASWAEAIRAYNGSGQRARDYRDAVLQRTQQAREAQTQGKTFVPSGL